MSSRPARRPRTAGASKNAHSEEALERFLVENRDEINAKLEEARVSIAAGKVAPLESLPELLRAARRYAKTRR
jgi:hypothetical protein